jgi:hypothetical protein
MESPAVASGVRVSGRLGHCRRRHAQRIGLTQSGGRTSPFLSKPPAARLNIRENLIFAFPYNAIGVPIAAGVLYPCARTPVS